MIEVYQVLVPCAHPKNIRTAFPGLLNLHGPKSNRLFIMGLVPFVQDTTYRGNFAPSRGVPPSERAARRRSPVDFTLKL